MDLVKKIHKILQKSYPNRDIQIVNMKINETSRDSPFSGWTVQFTINGIDKYPSEKFITEREIKNI